MLLPTRYSQLNATPEVLFVLGIGARPSITLLSVVGNIGSADATDLTALCKMAAEAPGVREIVLDLSRAAFAEPPTGVLTIADAHNAAEIAGVALRVDGSPPELIRQLVSAGVPHLLG